MTILEANKLNSEVFKNIQITSQENMIIKTLEKFYEDPININTFIPIINSESKISIRLIDHFVTKYSKTNKVVFKLNELDTYNLSSSLEKDTQQSNISFSVHTSYKQQLKAFQKKHFDPFSRGDRIPYFMGDNCVITTIGQLNFFKWFISKKIYDYVKLNQEVIENDMNKKNKIDKKKIKKDKNNKKIIRNQYIPIINTTSYNKPITTTEQKKDKIVVSFTF
jgi:hypothetical protein